MCCGDCQARGPLHAVTHSQLSRDRSLLVTTLTASPVVYVWDLWHLHTVMDIRHNTTNTNTNTSTNAQQQQQQQLNGAVGMMHSLMGSGGVGGAVRAKRAAAAAQDKQASDFDVWLLASGLRLEA
jgi:hypothetical protein